MNGIDLEIISKKEITKLRELESSFLVSRRVITKWLKEEYLQYRYGQGKAIQIYERLWGRGYLKDSKRIFRDKISRELQFYPHQIERIDTMVDYAKICGVDYNTMRDWVCDYLLHTYGKEKAEKIKEEIWSRNIIEYSDIEQFILANHPQAELLTSEDQWNLMDEQPAFRYIEIKCKHGHEWSPRVHHILHQESWCPYCREYRCEARMRLILEELFKARLPRTTLKSALGLPWERHYGRLQFDGYALVTIRGKVYKIAFEYDGVQHDKYPNFIHTKKIQYQDQRLNDILKKLYAVKYGVIIIRLKAVDGFTLDNFGLWEAEIRSQFFDATGINLPKIASYEFGPMDKYL